MTGEGCWERATFWVVTCFVEILHPIASSAAPARWEDLSESVTGRGHCRVRTNKLFLLTPARKGEVTARFLEMFCPQRFFPSFFQLDCFFQQCHLVCILAGEEPVLTNFLPCLNLNGRFSLQNIKLSNPVSNFHYSLGSNVCRIILSVSYYLGE